MSNTYRALSVAAKSEYGEDPVELDLSVAEEKDAIDGGHLELVPRTYRVLSDNFSAGPESSTFEGVFRKETEAALIQGQHIERVDTVQDKPQDELPSDAPDADAVPPTPDPPQDVAADPAPLVDEPPAGPAADKKGK